MAWSRARSNGSKVASLLAAVAGVLVGVVPAAMATQITSPGGGESFDIHPGDSFRVGYDFTIPGNNDAVAVAWSNPRAVVNYTCPDGSAGAFAISMPNYKVTVSDGQWYPSGDQHSPLVFQGSLTAPDGCGGGATMHQNHIAVFTADVTSDPSNVSLHYRFHDVDNNASGSWSSTNSVTTSPITQTIQGEIFKCVGGVPSTSLVSGGNLAVSALGLASVNPLAAAVVPAGSYAMTAAAPSGQKFVACGQSGVTISSPGSASQAVVVPSGSAGDGKFYVQPITYGYVEVCKSSANGVAGTFSFTVNGTTFSVPAGACGSAMKVPSGTLVVHENATTGYKMADGSATPTSRLQSVDLSRSDITVTIVAGDISTQTIVTVANMPVAGTIKICQVADTGIAQGSLFSFSNTANSQVVQVPAGPTPGGYCVILNGVFTGGQQVTITQAGHAGASVSSIVVAPADRLVGSPNLVSAKTTIVVGSGVTEISYTDRVGS